MKSITLLPDTIAEIIFDENELHDSCKFEHEDDDSFCETQKYQIQWERYIPDAWTRYLLITNNGVTFRHKVTLEVSKGRRVKS